MALVLVAAGCASGGGPGISSVRVDQGKLAARMAILQELTEPATPTENGEHSTGGLGGDAAEANAGSPGGQINTLTLRRSDAQGLRQGAQGLRQSDVQGGAGLQASELGRSGGGSR